VPDNGLLGRVVHRWPTPCSGDYRSPNLNPSKNGQPEPTSGHALPAIVGGSLNPDWVELLMGWPKGWTDLEPVADAAIPGWGEGWEDGTPRVASGVKHRVNRLKCIGNGQVPACAAMAWKILCE